MRIISTQFHVNVNIVRKHIGDKEHKIGVNLISPDYGVCVDGHHGYVASLIDHKPLRIVVLSLKYSEGLTSAALLDHWSTLSDKPMKHEDGTIAWNFYDLMTGYLLDERILLKVCEAFPDYNYA